MKHIHLPETSSTNTHLRELLSKNSDLESFTVITAHCQTAGRGQKGNHWESNPGENITLSMLIRPKLGEATTFDLSIVAALATRDTIHRALDGQADVQVKWPNDILIEERKIAGILIENEFSGSNIECCIIGLGLNVSQMNFGHYSPEATSIAKERQHLGLTPIPKRIDEWMNELLHTFVDEIERRLTEMTDDLETLRSEYHEHLYRRGEKGCLYRTPEGKTFRGTLRRVDPSGILYITDDDSEESYHFAFKEVQFAFPEP